MQSMNHSIQSIDCARVQNIELIAPPTYNEATTPPAVKDTEVIQYYLEE